MPTWNSAVEIPELFPRSFIVVQFLSTKTHFLPQLFPPASLMHELHALGKTISQISITRETKKIFFTQKEDPPPRKIPYCAKGKQNNIYSSPSIDLLKLSGKNDAYLKAFATFPYSGQHSNRRPLLNSARQRNDWRRSRDFTPRIYSTYLKISTLSRDPTSNIQVDSV